jgi:pimeloyl-ACP methyl ester carboxylesterase
MRAYASREQLAARLLQFNARLLPERAVFLAHALRSSELPDGQFGRRLRPLAQGSFAAALPRRGSHGLLARDDCTGTMLVTADEGYVLQRFGKHPGELQRRMACFANGSIAHIDDCGHNVQHDRPEKLAELIESFFGHWAERPPCAPAAQAPVAPSRKGHQA